MHPILFTIGNLNVPTYTVLLDLGLILGLVLTYFEGRRQLGSGELALDLGLWAVIGGILGGRVGYVLANWSTFAEDWTEAFQIWKGGLSFHGAFLGGLLVLALFALLQRRKQDPLSFWELSDLLTLGMGLGLVFGWAACLMGGCSYGYPGEGFGYAVLPDISGVEASRFATQIFGVIFALVLLVIFWLLRGRWPFAGASFLMLGLLYFTSQFFLEGTRGDGAIYVGPYRLAQVLDLGLALLAAGGLLILWWRSRGEEEELDEAEDQAGEEPEASEAPEEEPEEAAEVEGGGGIEAEQPDETATSEVEMVGESETPVGEDLAEEEPSDEG